jgi:hypothetical protein
VTGLDGDPPVSQARQWLREQARDHGADCPVCKRFTKVYRRSINSGMAYALAMMWSEHGTGWQDKTVTLRGVGAAARDESLLRYWGLIEEDQRRREDGGRAGWWRVTETGAEFAVGRRSVPKYALVYDSRCLGVEGPPVTIRDCLRDRFDLEELLERPAQGDAA